MKHSLRCFSFWHGSHSEGAPCQTTGKHHTWLRSNEKSRLKKVFILTGFSQFKFLLLIIRIIILAIPDAFLTIIEE